MRFDDSPNLFGSGLGTSTIGWVTCDWCGKSYNEDNEGPDGEPVDLTHPSMEFTDFAGKQICYCCFEKIENEILHRMPDILKWYRRIIDSQKERLQKRDSLLIDIETMRGLKL